MSVCNDIDMLHIGTVTQTNGINEDTRVSNNLKYIL